MRSTEDVYLVYSLRLGKGVFAGDFTILKAQDNNNKLAIEAWDSPRTLSKDGTVWKDDKVAITAKETVIKSYRMIIGRATYQDPEWVNAFVAIELKPELSPILIGEDSATEYNVFFQDGPNGTLTAQKNSTGKALKFEFPTHGGKKSATTPEKEPPGRFNAEKDNGNDHNLHGFVLPHRIWENGQAHRVLVGCTLKSHLPGPDDIDPYVAISVSPGPGPGEEG